MTDTMTIKIGDDEITIKRVKMKNLTEVTRAFSPFLKEFERIVKADKVMDNSALLQLVGSYADETIMLATVLTNKPSSYYKELEPLEFLQVMQSLVSFSGDFFLTQIFMPLIQIGQTINTLGTTAYYASQNMDSEPSK